MCDGPVLMSQGLDVQGVPSASLRQQQHLLPIISSGSSSTSGRGMLQALLSSFHDTRTAQQQQQQQQPVATGSGSILLRVPSVPPPCSPQALSGGANASTSATASPCGSQCFGAVVSTGAPPQVGGSPSATIVTATGSQSAAGACWPQQQHHHTLLAAEGRSPSFKRSSSSASDYSAISDDTNKAKCQRTLALSTSVHASHAAAAAAVASAPAAVDDNDMTSCSPFAAAHAQQPPILIGGSLDAASADQPLCHRGQGQGLGQGLGLARHRSVPAGGTAAAGGHRPRIARAASASSAYGVCFHWDGRRCPLEEEGSECPYAHTHWRGIRNTRGRKAASASVEIVRRLQAAYRAGSNAAGRVLAQLCRRSRRQQRDQHQQHQQRQQPIIAEAEEEELQQQEEEDRLEGVVVEGEGRDELACCSGSSDSAGLQLPHQQHQQQRQQLHQQQQCYSAAASFTTSTTPTSYTSAGATTTTTTTTTAAMHGCGYDASPAPSQPPVRVLVSLQPTTLAPQPAPSAVANALPGVNMPPAWWGGFAAAGGGRTITSGGWAPGVAPRIG